MRDILLRKVYIAYIRLSMISIYSQKISKLQDRDLQSYIHRDDINVIGKLSTVNGKVKEMANKDNFVFIDNSHIHGRAVNYI